MKLSVDALSVKGPVRDKNEDMLSIAGRMLRDSGFRGEDETGDFWYAFVADGMGGHADGEEASRELLWHLRDCFTMGDFSEDGFEEDFIRAVEYVSAGLNARSSYSGLEKPMGTTLCGIVWIFGRCYLVNAGDSRLYRYRDGMLEQLSEDQKDAGGYLLNCVGAGMAGTPVVKDITDEVTDDDIIIICSDGVSGYVGPDELEYFLTVSCCPAEDICDRAEINGGTDNSSIALIRVGGGDFGDGDAPDDDGRWDWYA